MPRLTPDKDAALQEELRRDLPKIEKVTDKINRQLEGLSDLGQMKALVDLTLLFMLRNMPNERDALAWTEHFHRQLDPWREGGIFAAGRAEHHAVISCASD